MRHCLQHVHTEAFDLYFCEDGLYAFPPPELTVKLTGMCVRGEISAMQLRQACEDWRRKLLAALEKARPAEEPGCRIMDIPKDKSYPPNAVQCDGCGGHGCATCEGKGWVLTTVKDMAIEALGGNSRRRLCAREGCGNPIAPDCVAVYCSNECAYEDA